MEKNNENNNFAEYLENFNLFLIDLENNNNNNNKTNQDV